MKPSELVIRCYAEKKDDIWVAVCIDLCLSAQADSLTQVKEKLINQIGEYVYDALAGEDMEYSGQLLLRKAPLSQRLKYFQFSLMRTLHLARENLFDLFSPTLPVAPSQT